jgi:hypothetical protein
MPLREALEEIENGSLAPLMSEFSRRSIAVSYVVRGRKPEGYDERAAQIAADLGEEWRRIKRDYYAARLRVVAVHGGVFRLLTEGTADLGIPDLPDLPNLETALAAGRLSDPMTEDEWPAATERLTRAADEITMLLHKINSIIYSHKHAGR